MKVLKVASADDLVDVPTKDQRADDITAQLVYLEFWPSSVHLSGWALETARRCVGSGSP